ncbi:hypothetical protein [Novosphingobium sp.]|uniref:hypothetical protein n=1 Tax=Novosphingobium sp. TaxID=1874826 RepID=UPI0025D426EE|nr:hypothetical protein [Novosphingobium sp.]
MLQSAPRFSTARIAFAGIPLLALALSACAKNKGELVVDDGVGVTALRSACPAVGIPDYTGDVTLFSAPDRTDAGAIDVTATMTNLRSTCDDQGDAAKIYTIASFDVLATRTDVRGARRVQLPYFSTVIRAGNNIVAKRVGTVTLDFADGQARASAHAQAGSYVDRSEATLSRDIKDKLNRKRKAGDTDAAIDPLAQPEVRSAISKASFELLVGFALDQKQLAYNVTR